MRLSDIDKQIEELQKQKDTLVQKEHDDALKAAQEALDKVNELGYKYRITGGTQATTKRRTGVRDDVLKAVKAGNGMKPAEIAQSLGMDDAKGKQSVANALSALKKTGKITATDGAYTAN